MDHRPPPLCRNPPPHHNNPPPYRNTPPHNNTPSSTGDPRIHRRSVLDSEQLRTPFPPSPSTDERLTEFQSEFQRSQAAMVNLMQSMQALQASMQLMLEKLDRRSERSRSPDSHHRREDVPHHQEIPEVPALASLLIKRSETKSMEVIAPAPILQNPVRRCEVVEEVWVQQVQEFQEVVADQVFEKMPQPTTQTVNGESEGTKIQKPEAPQTNNPSKGLEIHHVQKVSKFEIDFFKDDAKLEMSLGVKEVQDYAIIFPAIDSEESSYLVEGNCKLKPHDVPMIVLLCSQEISRDGGEMERIGVG